MDELNTHFPGSAYGLYPPCAACEHPTCVYFAEGTVGRFEMQLGLIYCLDCAKKCGKYSCKNTHCGTAQGFLLNLKLSDDSGSGIKLCPSCNGTDLELTSTCLECGEYDDEVDKCPARKDGLHTH